MHRHFCFPIATLQLFQHPHNVKISILGFTLSRRNAISPEVFNDYQKLFFRWKKRKVAIGVGNFKAQTFSFCHSNVATFPTSRNCKNFNFPLYTVPAEMLYLQKYLTNFQKLFFRWKKRKVTIVIGNFNCTDIFVFQRQRYNFSNIPKM